MTLIRALAPIALLLSACTPDVDTPEPEPDLYALSDIAFGEYLVHLEVPGVSSRDVDGALTYFVDTSQVDGVADLSLSKTSSSVEALTEAGVATAEVKLVNLDGLQHFVNLQSLSLTANDVTDLDLFPHTELTTLGLNFNLIGDLDVSNNAKLTELRYRGSAQAESPQLISTIDLSNNTELRHLFLPNHNIVTIDLSANLKIDDTLDLSGNPGPDGDPDTPDIVVPAQIYDQVPPENRLGVVSDEGIETLVTLTANGLAFAEDGGTVQVTANLNVKADQAVTVQLAFAGSATLDADYESDLDALTIAPGETTASLTLTGIDDVDAEGSETVTVEITGATNAELGGQVQVSIALDDDDLAVDFVLNEVLYDPSNAGDDNGDGKDDGDANGDGVYVQDEDEFIELVNVSDGPLDLSGWTVFDSSATADGVPRHTFPTGSIVPVGGALVLFGGGTPTGDFGGAVVQTTTTGAMNLGNSGDLLTIVDPDGFVVVTFDTEPLSNNPNESYTRNPDLTGEFEQHADSTELLYSPGTRRDGTPF